MPAGRPKAKDKMKALAIRLFRDEMLDLAQLANNDGRSMSAYVRNVIRLHMKDAGCVLWPSNRPRKERAT